MLSIVLSAFIFYAANAASKIKVEWHFCDGQDGKECANGKYSNTTELTFDPNPPKPGKNVCEIFVKCTYGV